MRRLLLAVSCVLAASAVRASVTITLDLPDQKDAAAQAKAADAEASIKSLLDGSPTALRGGKSVVYRAAEWSRVLPAEELAAKRKSLTEAWGPALHIEEGRLIEQSGSNAASAAAPVNAKVPKAPALDPAGLNKFYDNQQAAGGVAGVAGSGAGGKDAKSAPAAPQKSGVDFSALDRTADKCSDFFQYACGGWVKSNPIPKDQSRWGRFNELEEQNRAILHGILEKAAAAGQKREDATDKKIGDYYAACMDQKAADKAGAAPLAPLLGEISALGDKSGLPALLAKLQAQGVGGFFSFGSGQDYQNADMMIAQADQGGWSLPDRDYYLKDDYAKDLAAFEKHVVKMFELAGDKPAQASAEAGAVMTVETGLAKAAMDRVARREPSNVHHKTALAAFAATTPDFSWTKYLASARTPKFESLDVVDPAFFTGMDALIKGAPLASLKSYLRWQAIHALAGQLSSAFVNEDFDFFGKHLDGQQVIQTRWKRCVTQVDGNLGEALGKVYVEQQFPASAKAQTEAQIVQIEAAMKEDLTTLTWMSAETRQKSLDKLAAVANQIGYPDKWRNYAALSITRGDSVGNALRAAQFEERRQLDKIGKPADRKSWDMTPPTVNAYYDPQMNNINFPAGILKPPFFTAGGDDAVNYGGIGAVEGHELTHGFDDEGRHYDGKGNLSEWWTPQDSQAFEQRAKALADQYSQYVAVKDPGGDPKKDIHVNGELTLGENTADNGGLRLAYSAMVKNLKPEDNQVLDGLTAQKRFFLGWAQVWCSNQTDAQAKVLAVTDPHSPPKDRVNGAVSNMPEFAAAFSCKPGAPMNPATRNGVW